MCEVVVIKALLQSAVAAARVGGAQAWVSSSAVRLEIRPVFCSGHKSPDRVVPTEADRGNAPSPTPSVQSSDHFSLFAFRHAPSESRLERFGETLQGGIFASFVRALTASQTAVRPHHRRSTRPRGGEVARISPTQFSRLTLRRLRRGTTHCGRPAPPFTAHPTSPVTQGGG